MKKLILMVALVFSLLAVLGCGGGGGGSAAAVIPDNAVGVVKSPISGQWRQDGSWDTVAEGKTSRCTRLVLVYSVTAQDPTGEFCSGNFSVSADQIVDFGGLNTQRTITGSGKFSMSKNTINHFQIISNYSSKGAVILSNVSEDPFSYVLSSITSTNFYITNGQTFYKQ